MRLRLVLVTPLLLAFAGQVYADIPRTPDGRPDLQGVWANNSATPLERPDALAGKTELTAEEIADFKLRQEKLFSGGGEAAFGDDVYKSIVEDDEEHESYDPTTGNYNQFWVVEREIESRTSLIVDPPNGRLPELTKAGAERAAAQAAYVAEHPADSYTDRINSDRCITFGVPYIAAGYNGYFQIAQTADHVAFLQEMAHETRIVPVAKKAHIDARIRQWNGDSRGRWEGDTFVVETKNFAPKTSFMTHSAEHLNLTERFTRIDEATLQWALTIDDAGTWEQPWTLVINLKKSPDEIFEYACHEGNMSMEGILAGARAEEAAAVSGGNE
jgi:hypothetical protein